MEIHTNESEFKITCPSCNESKSGTIDDIHGWAHYHHSVSCLDWAIDEDTFHKAKLLLIDLELLNVIYGEDESEKEKVNYEVKSGVKESEKVGDQDYPLITYVDFGPMLEGAGLGDEDEDEEDGEDPMEGKEERK